MPKSKSFLVLIGSFARGNPSLRSDVDLVAIGFSRARGIETRYPRGRKINWIEYSFPRFTYLHRRGDLFIHHVLTEGKLLEGDTKMWASLVRNFRVRTQFKREIRKNQKVIDFLLSDRENLQSPIAFLSSFLRALKQVAIFRLAEKREYVFAKDQAIRRVYSWIPDTLLEGMLDAEHILTRETKVNRNRDLKRLTRCAERLFDLATTNQHRLL